MDHSLDDTDSLADNSWGRSWEDQIIEEISGEREAFDQQSKLDQEIAAQQLWASFQTSASAVANLFKDCLQEENCWIPFQNAAGAVTDLYKEAIDIQKKAYERGLQIGYNKKIRDILTWAKKKRRSVRRDELIAFICGKPAPVKSQRHSPPRSRIGSRSHSEKGSPLSSASRVDSVPDLTPFQNALAIQGLNGAMSSVSMGYSSAAKTKSEELNCLIMDGLSRHNESRKRSNDGLDLNSDSPFRKRTRFLM